MCTLKAPQSKTRLKWTSQIISSRFIHSKAATIIPLPIERALKTDLVTILAVYDANSNIILHCGRLRDTSSWCSVFSRKIVNEYLQPEITPVWREPLSRLSGFYQLALEQRRKHDKKFPADRCYFSHSLKKWQAKLEKHLLNVINTLVINIKYRNHDGISTFSHPQRRCSE